MFQWSPVGTVEFSVRQAVGCVNDRLHPRRGHGQLCQAALSTGLIYVCLTAFPTDKLYIASILNLIFKNTNK